MESCVSHRRHQRSQSLPFSVSAPTKRGASLSSPDSMSQNKELALTDDLWSLSELSIDGSDNNLYEPVAASIDNQPEHWSCDNLKSRISSLFLNEFMSDVSFIFTESSSQNVTEIYSLPGHKFILASASSVFYAMFYGPLAETNKQITISDIDSDVFAELLRYLYCDHFIADDVEHLLGLIYAAKKYFLKHLCDQCVHKLQLILCCNNACLIFEQALLYDLTELANQALEFIDAQTEMCLSSECTSYISLSTIRIILCRSTLNTSESKIYDALERWCTAQVLRTDPVRDSVDTVKQCSAVSCRRRLAGDAVELIRFTTMKLSEFANGAAQSDLLTPNEIADIFLHFTAEKVPKLIFPVDKRVGLKTRRCSRFKSSAFRTNQWRYRGRCDCIQFTVSRRIFLTGIGLFGSSNGSPIYKVKLEIKRTGTAIHTEDTDFESNGTSAIFTVPLNGSPVQIDAAVRYTVGVTMQGTELSYFGQDGMAHVRVEPDIEFDFYTTPESTNGTGVQGGQIAELYFFCPSIKSKTM